MTFTDATLLVEDMRGATAWTCDDCAALVVDHVGEATNRRKHERWHVGVNRSINEASPDFVGY